MLSCDSDPVLPAALATPAKSPTGKATASTLSRISKRIRFMSSSFLLRLRLTERGRMRPFPYHLPRTGNSRNKLNLCMLGRYPPLDGAKRAERDQFETHDFYRAAQCL